jgi:hypothetical protein
MPITTSILSFSSSSTSSSSSWLAYCHSLQARQSQARHDQRIALLFELDNLETKLQHMLVLERHSALGQLRHGDNMSQFVFGLKPPHTYTQCCGPSNVPGSTKMFPKPREYMWWRNAHFLLPYYCLGHTLHAYVLFCALTLPLFGALCASKNRTHKFMRHGLDSL